MSAGADAYCKWGYGCAIFAEKRTERYMLTPIVIQSEAKNLGYIHMDILMYATEILPPFGRLNDK